MVDLDILIIGAGPIGLACGIEAKAANLSYIIIEKGCLVNSLYNYPVNMTFFSSAERLEIGETPFVTTNPKPKRAEALEYYRRICQKFELNTHLFEEVVTVDPAESSTYIVSTNKATYRARHIIVATGFYDIPMLLNVPGEDLSKVRHYYNDPHYYAGQHVIVVGASNSSIDAALETYRKGAKVTLVIRGHEVSPRVKYWVRPDIENRIAFKEIDVLYNSHIHSISEEAAEVSTPQGLITLKNDFVLALTGYRPNFDFLKKIGINVPEESPMIPEHNEETMETNMKGIYLAGVVCGGLNTHLWFIENSRVHATQIINHITSGK
ncbi:bacillithiol system thiol disulfide oxidoreductase, YpdA family [Sphingobacterium spiritivorum ATCC 33300]|uniref:Bacillithiol system thiol disulfide oxidoreductase, YpdA family n=1 Tax=Sphingobacterium spiritivorum ATCC 33300 TaxID=525372 RepID=C2G5J1_SPHSI|nr:YpdA family putative bacillithiol disulfide reductase [Sphingobacterium spiritivorum]EEI89557.1 bacillithiol system thiol disulfide oxidoreductase, YpdA family [Sphingobacterium spiritivorum ATCC 33300]QQS94561.1 YpdA family putative bacillithiol disulfide reductase [Sphingobacterium spiritivorum]